MISLSFLNLLGVDIIQLFWVCLQWASSVRRSHAGLLGEAEGWAATRREPQAAPAGGPGEAGGGKRSEPRTRLARAPAPCSRLEQPSVLRTEGARGRGPERPGAQTNSSSDRAAGAAPCPPRPGPGHFLYGRGADAGFEPGLRTIVRAAPGARGRPPGEEGREGPGEGEPRGAQRASFPSCSAAGSARGVPPGGDAAAAAPAARPSAKVPPPPGRGRSLCPSGSG